MYHYTQLKKSLSRTDKLPNKIFKVSNVDVLFFISIPLTSDLLITQEGAFFVKFENSHPPARELCRWAFHPLRTQEQRTAVFIKPSAVVTFRSKFTQTIYDQLAVDVQEQPKQGWDNKQSISKHPEIFFFFYKKNVWKSQEEKKKVKQTKIPHTTPCVLYQHFNRSLRQSAFSMNQTRNLKNTAKTLKQSLHSSLHKLIKYFKLLSEYCINTGVFPNRNTSFSFLTSSSLYQDKLSAVRTNQYSLDPPFMMPMLLMVSQPFRMTYAGCSQVQV